MMEQAFNVVAQETEALHHVTGDLSYESSKIFSMVPSKNLLFLCYYQSWIYKKTKSFASFFSKSSKFLFSEKPKRDGGPQTVLGSS